MAQLQITITNTDHGTPTGEAAQTIRRTTYAIDAVSNPPIVTNSPAGTTDADTAQYMRDVLTAGGVTWDTEAAVIVQ